MRKKLGLADKVIEEPEADTSLIEAAREIAGTDLAEAFVIADKIERRDKVIEIRTSLEEKLLEKFEEMTTEQFRSVCCFGVRGDTLDQFVPGVNVHAGIPISQICRFGSHSWRS